MDQRCCSHCKSAQEDHDLLIQIATTLKNFSDQESRIRRLERWGFLAIGGLVVLQVILKVQ